MEPRARAVGLSAPRSPRGALTRGLRALLDPFLVSIIATMVLAIVLPLGETPRAVASGAADVAVALLFLAYGMRLPTREVLEGLRNWRLQLAIVVSTYAIFPLLGLAVHPLATPLVGSALAAGLLYTALLPSTVQSSVAFTSIARGNVPGALCAATLSNIGGMFVSPALVLLVMGRTTSGGGGIGDIVSQLLVPFVVGQLLQPLVGGWVRAHRGLTLAIDRGTIVLAVFSAVAAATAIGVWEGVTALQVLALVGLCALVLAAILAVTWWGGRLLGLRRADRIALLMCGSKKSLATGLPMGLVLFPAATAATMVVPVVIFHQLQLVVCTIIADHLARTDPEPALP